MNVQQQNEWCLRFMNDVAELWPSCWSFVVRSMEIFKRKGPDYAPENIALLDVFRVAFSVDVTPEKILYILAQKQWTAVGHFVQKGHVESESIHSRLNDIANYAALMDFLISNRLQIAIAIKDLYDNEFHCEFGELACRYSPRSESDYCTTCKFRLFLVLNMHQPSIQPPRSV